MKIKIIETHEYETLEKYVNEFIRNICVINILIHQPNDGFRRWGCTITYREEEI